MHAEPCDPRNITLSGGNENAGNVRICNEHNLWSYVFDVEWGQTGANVACRMLERKNNSMLCTDTNPVLLQ